MEPITTHQKLPIPNIVCSPCYPSHNGLSATLQIITVRSRLGVMYILCSRVRSCRKLELPEESVRRLEAESRRAWPGLTSSGTRRATVSVMQPSTGPSVRIMALRNVSMAAELLNPSREMPLTFSSWSLVFSRPSLYTYGSVIFEVCSCTDFTVLRIYQTKLPLKLYKIP